MPEGKVLVDGRAEGRALPLAAPLSLWGGLDPQTGRVIDPRHPQLGASVGGTILLLPAGRGSSSTSSILAEAIRVGTAPAAIVLGEPDPILALGAIVGRELTGVVVPIVAVGADALAELARAERIRVEGSSVEPV